MQDEKSYAQYMAEAMREVEEMLGELPAVTILPPSIPTPVKRPSVRLTTDETNQLVGFLMDNFRAEHRIGGRVSWFRDAMTGKVRFVHHESGFSAAYDEPSPLWDRPRIDNQPAWLFFRDLRRHVMRAEREAREQYQEPNVIQL